MRLTAVLGDGGTRRPPRPRRRAARASHWARAVRSAARSRGPMRQRAPVSSRASAVPASCAASTRSVATTSTTSGVVSRPPSPTTSTGSPAASSASASSGICERRRTSTAAVRSPAGSAVPGAAQLGRPPSAPRPRRSRCAPPRSVPGPAAGPGRSSTVLARRPGAQRRRDRVGGVQDRAVVAEAGRQREHGRRGGVGVGEGRRGTGRCCPRSRRASRRSTGTGRRPRSPGAPAPNRPRSICDLGVAGVLVLVEQHGGDTVPARSRRPPAAAASRAASGHLVGEVDGRQRRAWPRRSRCTSGSSSRRCRSRAEELLGRRPGTSRPDLVRRAAAGRTSSIVSAQNRSTSVGVDEVVGELAGHGQHVARRPTTGPRCRRAGRRCSRRDDRVGELPARPPARSAGHPARRRAAARARPPAARRRRRR